MQTMRIALLDRNSHTVLRALSRSTGCSSDPDLGCVEAKRPLNPDSLSASDSDPKPHVERPYVYFHKVGHTLFSVGIQDDMIEHLPADYLSIHRGGGVLSTKDPKEMCRQHG